MKLYSAAPRASISMIEDGRMLNLWVEISKYISIVHILEAGTHIGLGSTKFIAEIFRAQSPAPQLFVTIEASHHNWRRARENLKAFPFVTPLWGLSTSLQEALRFIGNDPALQNHFKYPNIFIDDVEDPINFYSNEIAGRLGGRPSNPMNRIRLFVYPPRFYS